MDDLSPLSPCPRQRGLQQGLQQALRQQVCQLIEQKGNEQNIQNIRLFWISPHFLNTSLLQLHFSPAVLPTISQELKLEQLEPLCCS